MVLVLVVILPFKSLYSQDRNSKVFPFYALSENSGNDTPRHKILPVSILTKANFRLTQFDSSADFSTMLFKVRADFRDTKFQKIANFVNTEFYNQASFRFAYFEDSVIFSSVNFDSLADFLSVQFRESVDFRNTRFQHTADFLSAKFFKKADFRDSIFNGLADFKDSHFHSIACFRNANFFNQINFGSSRFDSLADFWATEFHRIADFKYTEFHDLVDFRYAKIKEDFKFNSTIFFNQIDFRGTSFIDSSEVDFSLATILDTVFIGNYNSIDIQRYDFQRALLKTKGKITYTTNIEGELTNSQLNYPGAKIILFGPVDLKIQLEKFEFLELHKFLNYYTKKDIISQLKNNSFRDNKFKKEHFELDYLLELSTMYQKVSVNYDEYSIINPIRWWKFLYYITMGFGYRPFRLIYWILIVLLGFAVFYMYRMPHRINAYIIKNHQVRNNLRSEISKEIELDLYETLINCLYFSVLTFFTFRLKGDYLTFFDKKEKGIIISQWFIGFIFYLAFFMLSKSGSILQNLKDLFVG